MTDYKSYSLDQLSNWLHDAMSAGEATPQEIYDVIVGVVKETCEYHKQEADRAEELLSLLNSGWTKEEVLKEKEYYEPSSTVTFSSCSSDDTSPECMTSWNDFWSDDRITSIHNTEDGDLFTHEEDKVVKWRLPVQVDGLTGDCYINLPDDLLERAELKEGDILNWVDNGDGSFTLQKVEEPEVADF